MTATIDRPARTDTVPGPPLTVLAVVSTGLLVAGLVASTVVAGATFPGPDAAPDLVASWFRDHPGAARLTGVFTFASAVPLALYAATASTRLRTLGVRTAGATIALVGGTLAAGFLALSGMVSWTLAQPTTGGSVHTLHALAFVTGGPGHVVLLGLLVAGLAVPGLLARLLPRWFALTGITLAAVAELGTLALVAGPATFLLPVARFGGLAWLIAAAALLPVRRSNSA